MSVMAHREINAWLMDMDGVLVHEEQAIAGADAWVARLRELELPFQVLTNNSIYTARDLSARLRLSGIDVPEERIWTSALATGRFLQDQRPGGSAFVIGEAGLTTALHDAGYTLTERDPDYVVLGETRTYSFQRITLAIRLITGGARFIATNPDPTGPSVDGPLPATGSVAALITRATGIEPYYVGKPNPLMMRSALNQIDAHSESAAMIGDRMDTDVVSGMEAGMHTVLVLTGSTTRDAAERHPPPTGRRGSSTRSPTCCPSSGAEAERRLGGAAVGHRTGGAGTVSDAPPPLTLHTDAPAAELMCDPCGPGGWIAHADGATARNVRFLPRRTGRTALIEVAPGSGRVTGAPGGEEPPTQARVSGHRQDAGPAACSPAQSRCSSA